MKNALNHWWIFLIKGIILILLAIFTFQHPIDTLVGLALYIGIAALFMGVFLIYSSLSGPRDEGWGWILATGLLDVFFGIILLANPMISATALPLVIGFWILVNGISTFVGSFASKKDGNADWWFDLLMGVLIVLSGLIISTDFLSGALVITFWIGFALLLAGVFSIRAALRMRKLHKLL